MKTASLTLAVLLFSACASEDEPSPGVDVLSVENLDVDGYTIWEPAQRQNDPRAGGPEYVYLEIGVDGVELPGPVVADPSLCVLDDAGMTWEVSDEGYEGMTVVVNDRLSYRFDIDDFEDEVGVARLDLWVEDDGVHSRFVLIADGRDGVAHLATVRAIVDGVAGEPTAPVTIEARPVGF